MKDDEQDPVEIILEPGRSNRLGLTLYGRFRFLLAFFLGSLTIHIIQELTYNRELKIYLDVPKKKC